MHATEPELVESRNKSVGLASPVRPGGVLPSVKDPGSWASHEREHTPQKTTHLRLRGRHAGRGEAGRGGCGERGGGVIQQLLKLSCLRVLHGGFGMCVRASWLEPLGPCYERQGAFATASPPELSSTADSRLGSTRLA
jgi:hypothetical protein